MKQPIESLKGYLNPQDTADHLEALATGENLLDEGDTFKGASTQAGINRTLHNQVGDFCRIVNSPELAVSCNTLAEKLSFYLRYVFPSHKKSKIPAVSISLFSHKGKTLAFSIILMPKKYQFPFARDKEEIDKKEISTYLIIHSQDEEQEVKICQKLDLLMKEITPHFSILPSKIYHSKDVGALALFAVLRILFKQYQQPNIEISKPTDVSKTINCLHQLFPKLNLPAYHQNCLDQIYLALQKQGIELEQNEEIFPVLFKEEFADGYSPFYTLLYTKNGYPIEVRILGLEDDNRARREDYIRRAESLVQAAMYILNSQDHIDIEESRIIDQINRAHHRFLQEINDPNTMISPGEFKKPLWKTLSNKKLKKIEKDYSTKLSEKHKILADKLATLLSSLITYLSVNQKWEDIKKSLREAEVKCTSQQPVPILVHLYEVNCGNSVTSLMEIQQQGYPLLGKQIINKALTDYYFELPSVKEREHTHQIDKDYFRQKLAIHGINLDSVINLLPANWKTAEEYKKIHKKLTGFLEEVSDHLKNLPIKTLEKDYADLISALPSADKNNHFFSNAMFEDEHIFLIWKSVTLYVAMINKINEGFHFPILVKSLSGKTNDKESFLYWHALEDNLTEYLSDIMQLLMVIDGQDDSRVHNSIKEIKRPVNWSNPSSVRYTEGISNARLCTNNLELTFFRSSSKPPIQVDWETIPSMVRMIMAVRNVEQSIAGIIHYLQKMNHPSFIPSNDSPEQPLALTIFSHSLLSPFHATDFARKKIQGYGDETQMLWDDFVSKRICHHRVFRIDLGLGKKIWVRPNIITINEPINVLSQAPMDETQGYIASEGYTSMLIQWVHFLNDFFKEYDKFPNFIESAPELNFFFQALKRMGEISQNINPSLIFEKQRKMDEKYQNLHKLLIQYECISLGIFIKGEPNLAINDIKKTWRNEIDNIRKEHEELKIDCKAFIREWKNNLKKILQEDIVGDKNSTKNIWLDYDKLYQFYLKQKSKEDKTTKIKLSTIELNQEYSNNIGSLFIHYFYERWKNKFHISAKKSKKDINLFQKWDRMVDSCFLFFQSIGSYEIELNWSDKEATPPMNKFFKKLGSKNLKLIHNHRATTSLLFFKSLDYPVEFYCKSGEDRTGYINMLILAYQLFWKIKGRFPQHKSIDDMKSLDIMMDSFIEYSASRTATDQNAPGARGLQSSLTGCYNQLVGGLAKSLYGLASPFKASDRRKKPSKNPIDISKIHANQLERRSSFVDLEENEGMLSFSPYDKKEKPLIGRDSPIQDSVALKNSRHYPSHEIKIETQVDNDLFEIFIESVESNDVAQVQEAIKRGVPVNEFTLGGKTALHLAAEGNAVKIIEILINAGADINLQTIDEGQTPLHLATCYGHHEAIDKLISFNPDLSILDYNNEKPLASLLFFKS